MNMSDDELVVGYESVNTDDAQQNEKPSKDSLDM